ncbi:MAG: MoaD/ThiS family protein [Xanthomonadales bacterium]|nr:MoaD/ThiS family protein [Xanthomonadales bacterium]
MKTIRIRYFAAYREAVGTSAEEIATAAGTAAELFEELAHRHPDLERFPGMRVAVNDELVEWGAALRDRDTVLLFPPVAGG